MRSLNHVLVRWYAERRIAERKAHLEEEISRVLDIAVRLELMGDGGRDSVYYANASGERVGVVRLVNPFKRRPFKKRHPLEPNRLWWALTAGRRLSREWDVYCRVSPAGLSPAPVWRTHDAIMCTYFDGQLVSKRNAADRGRFWKIIGATLHSLRRLHDQGVTHGDAKIENILTDAEARQFAFIDFDCTPPSSVEFSELKAYDYLKVVDSSLKLLPARDRPDQRRWVDVLKCCVDEETQHARLDLVRQRQHTTRHITRDPRLCSVLRRVFWQL